MSAVSQRAASGQEVITLDLDQEIVELSENVTPDVSAWKSVAGRGVKRSLAQSSNTAAQYGEETRRNDEVYYPAYLNNPAPTNLKIEELRRHAVISEIKKNDAMCNFFEVAKGVLGPLKNVLLASAGREIPTAHNGNDHTYQSQDPTK